MNYTQHILKKNNANKVKNFKSIVNGSLHESHMQWKQKSAPVTETNQVRIIVTDIIQ